MMMIVLLLVSAICVLWIWHRNNKRSKNEPPLASGGRIFIGHALQLTANSVQLWNIITKMSKEALQRGGVIKATIGHRTLYLISEPKDFLTIENTCFEKEATYNFAKSWIGNGLLTSAPPQWQIHRKLLNPAFGHRVVDSYIGVFNSQSRCLVKNLEVEVGKGPFDHSEHIKVISLETILLTVFGADLKEKNVIYAQYIASFEKVLNILITRFQYFWLHNNFLYSLSSLSKIEDECVRVLHNISDKILYQTRLKSINKNSNTINEQSEEKAYDTNFKSFMDLFLELFGNTVEFTDREIRDHVATIIMAGHDTSASTVTFCMLLVGSHDRVQKKIHEELKNVFNEEDRDVTKQDLNKLVYLDAVIKECLRLYPIAPVIGRHLHKDVKLRTCTLYKGNSVFLSIYGVNQHASWGPDVKMFKPERWLDSSTVPDYSKAFFGMGRRSCIGKYYAMISIKITLVHIYRKFIVHADDRNLKLKMDVVIRPISGHKISIEKRNS